MLIALVKMGHSRHSVSTGQIGSIFKARLILVRQYAHADGHAEVEMDWNWGIAVGLWTVELGLSGDRRNPL